MLKKLAIEEILDCAQYEGLLETGELERLKEELQLLRNAQLIIQYTVNKRIPLEGYIPAKGAPPMWILGNHKGQFAANGCPIFTDDDREFIESLMEDCQYEH